ncbi:hypothetical protein METBISCDRAFT_25081 [Metschnikowia bicuspidata]|uniref:Glucose-signaling factor 2 n=3 Tax=Metschnikowia bicuspidata TaxID=27322 RepID=A0A4P9Z777_9ASCO|nr:hypothetical protein METBISCDRAFT_25081 [Metschnikowia bicuspidata]
MSEKTADAENNASSFEIYLRFNDDIEKDYCLQITSATTFRDLLRVFRTLPIALRPSIFYDTMPKAFVVSTAPGYLTEDGSLLFSYDTSNPKYRKKVALDAIVARECWPGQLILPVWEFKYFLFYAFVLLLAVWLYTDLPDFISPTPGICMTNKLTVMLAKVAKRFGYGTAADALLADLNAPVGTVGQCLFFAFHVVKILALFFVVYRGVFNPSRIYRFGKVPEITKEFLIDLGWTGSKRATIDEYKEEYRDYKIKEYGGMVAAHQAGLFNKLKNLGCHLGDDEGFNTPVGNRDEGQHGKVPMSYKLLVKQAEFFELHTAGFDVLQMNEAVRQFRRYGMLHFNETLAKMVQARKAISLPETAE